jgi:hypothetical protein
MAQIPTYTASVATRSAGVPSVNLQAPDAAALANVGGAIQDVAAVFQQRQEQRDDFKAKNNFRKFELGMARGLVEAEQNAPADGEGFHDGFIQNVYRPQRDAFLASVPARLRPQYETMLNDDMGSISEEWSIKAAEKERSIASNWVKNEIGITQNELANGISQDPKAFDSYLQSGMQLIDDAPYMTQMEKQQARQAWTTFAETAYLNRVMEDDPQLLLRELNANPNKLSPATQFDTLSAAVQYQESRGRVDAISPKGAVGTMQVMPGTARDIARDMGDPNFPKGGDPWEVTQYLLKPGVSKRYGEFYLAQQQKAFPNDVEAVLVAYNAGPGKAREWIKAGRDDGILAEETRNYKKKIMERLPGLVAPGQSGGTGRAPHVEFVFDRDGREPIAGQNVGKLNRDLVDRVSTAFAGLGIDKVKINSGYRSPGDNRRVGGVSNSEHVHGNAVDIDVSGYSTAERVAIINSLSANGITGIGVGSNMIHADTGGRRSWGYPSIPKWAQGAIAAHEANAAVAPRGGGRFSTLPYDQRQKFINAADQQLAARLAEEKKNDDASRVKMRQDMSLSLARISETGQPTPGFDETNIATVLGEDDYLLFVAKREEAAKMYNGRKDIALMTPQEMAIRQEAYKADPALDTFDSDLRVEAAVQKEVERVIQLRANQPDKAAQEFPDVKAAVEKVRMQGMEKGSADPGDVQAMVAIMMQRQKEMGVPPKAQAPVPREMAFEIGRTLSTIPSRGAGTTAQDTRDAIAIIYNSMRQYYGDWTDEVITYALSEYKTLPPETAKEVATLMERIASGAANPFNRPQQGPIQPVEEGWGEYLFGWMTDDDEEIDADAETRANEAIAPTPSPDDISAGPPPPSEDTITRARDILDTDDPNAEAIARRRYGDAAVDAAKRRPGAGEE